MPWLWQGLLLGDGGLGALMACEALIGPHSHRVCPTGHGSLQCPCLVWCSAADSELVWTKGNDKLGMGVTQESHKKLWYEFPLGGQGPSKHREGKADRDKQGCGTSEGVCE
jgi:hypothetical protein